MIQKYPLFGIPVAHLVLPKPNEPFAPGTDLPEIIAPSIRGAAGDAKDSEPVAGEDERGMYRWLLGHHVAVGAWRLLADHLRGKPEPPGPQPLAAADFFDMYTAAILYAGSCGNRLYNTVVRPAMRSCDPAFSGMWASDYMAVHQLLARTTTYHTSHLAQARRFNRDVHVAVAGRLVPSGVSLLREAGRSPAGPASENEQHLFDVFFRLERRIISRHALLCQLVARLNEARRDIDTYPITVRYKRRDINDFQNEISTRFHHLAKTMLPAAVEVAT